MDTKDQKPVKDTTGSHKDPHVRMVRLESRCLRIRIIAYMGHLIKVYIHRKV